MIYLFGARVVGPLEPYVVGYCECLARLGFTEATRAHHMSLVVHLSRWLAGERHDAGDLTVEVAHRYIGVRAAAGYSEFRSPRSLDRLLAYLRDVGAAPTAPAVVLTATDVLVDRFRAHLLSERGLRPNGAASYVASVLPFVARVAPDGGIDSSKVTARDVAESARGAVTPLPAFRFPEPLAEPDVRLSPHPALHGSVVRQPRAAAKGWGCGCCATGIA